VDAGDLVFLPDGLHFLGEVLQQIQGTRWVPPTDNRSHLSFAEALVMIRPSVASSR